MTRQYKMRLMTSLLLPILLPHVGASSPLFLPHDVDPSLAEEAEIGYSLKVQKEIAVATARIVGGQEATPGKYPFFVRLRGIRGSSTCGGSLVAPDVVLSAAHCDTTFNDEFTAAVNGYTSAAVNNLEEIRSSTSQKTKHPDFDINTYAYDYMLLKLDVPIPADKITPITLNRDPNVPVLNEPVTLIGLGTLSEIGSQFPTFLHEVEVNQVDDTSCFESYASVGLSIVKPDIMFCAQGDDKDACQGDSGSPIMSADGIQLGVVSFGLGCARAEFPGVYSRITGVQEWLDTNICELSDFCKDGVFDTATTVSVSEAPVTRAPVTKAPFTNSPIASTPVSMGPVTTMPISSSPITNSPISRAPITNAPVPAAPVVISSSPTTIAPITNGPIVTMPVSSGPVSNAPVPETLLVSIPMSSAPISNAVAVGTAAPGTAVPVAEIPSMSARPSEGSARPTHESRLQTTNPDSTAADEIVNPDGARGPSICDDFLDRTFSINIGSERRSRGRAARDCNWLQSQSKEVKDQYCVPGTDAYDACEETCGKCDDACSDEAAAVFFVYVGANTEPEARGCNWLRDRPAIKPSVCVEGHDAFSLCRETCNACGGEDQISVQGSFDRLFDALASRNRTADADTLADRLKRQEDGDSADTRTAVRTSDRIGGN